MVAKVDRLDIRRLPLAADPLILAPVAAPGGDLLLNRNRVPMPSGISVSAQGHIAPRLLSRTWADREHGQDVTLPLLVPDEWSLASADPQTVGTNTNDFPATDTVTVDMSRVDKLFAYMMADAGIDIWAIRGG